MTPLALTERETATVLAALQFWSSELHEEGAAFVFGSISTDEGRLAPMSEAEVEALAEKIAAARDGAGEGAS